MIRINYIKPTENESPDDIAIHNIVQSDKFKNLPAFCQSTVGWLRNDPNRNYQDLELLLRHLDLDTHLIAQPKETINIENFKITIPSKTNDTDSYDYVLWTSCKPREEAIKELLTYHTSYEENFECLSRTGCLTNIDRDFDINKISENTNNSRSDSDSNNEKQIANSELKYEFVSMSTIDSLNIIIKDLMKKYNEEPQKMVCGKYGESDVYALVINGEIISPIGWIQYAPDNIELIDFRSMKKTE